MIWTSSSVGRSIELIKGEEATPTQVLGDVFLTGRGRGIAPKTLGLSMRGTHIHSTLPLGATSAHDSQSERKAYCAIGGNGLRA